VPKSNIFGSSAFCSHLVPATKGENMHHVMIHPSSYQSCREAVDRAFELFPQEITRKKVVIKPNVLRSSTADEHIVTHPAILRAVVEKIEEMSPAAIVVGMEGNGPASPELREIGLVLAADNAVALDGVVARMMGLDPGRLRFLQKAKTMGLGDFDSQMTKIDGEMRILPDFKLPPLGGEAISGNQAMQELMRSKSQVRPQADPELCTACGTCIEHCPVSALTMKEDVPAVDADICITCFCCQEICPEKAMVLK
jgi:Pyruvate/2-oxoacid:ferredoxin oxidoreductase delta subunit